MAASQSQNYMVSIETILGTPQLESEIEGFEDFGPLYDSKFSFEKIVAPDAGADLFAAAQVSTSPLKITIYNDIYYQDLQNTFISGVPIAQITLLTLANVSGVNKISDKLVFNNNYIIGCHAGTLWGSTAAIFLEIRYTKYTHTVFQYQQNGTATGQTVSTFDLTKGTTG